MLTAMWAHRLANTLGLIRSIVDSAEEQIDDKKKVLELLRSLDKVATTELTAARDLMGLSRLSATSEIGPLDLNSLIRKVLAEFEEKIPAMDRTLSLVVDLDDHLPNARADEHLLAEVLRNLLDNSIKALDRRDDGRITVRTVVIEDELAIEITDNGGGIPPDVMARLFRGQVTTKRRRAAGFGLMISQTLVEALGGKLSFQSTDGLGTTVRITLRQWGPSTDMKTARRALVVDNDPNWLDSISKNLRYRHLSVDTAQSAAEATRLLASRQYDLALLDLRVGNDMDVHDVSGLNVARQVRELNPEALVVLMTGFPEVDLVQNAFRIGVDDLVQKESFLGADLDRVLERIAVRRETQRESIRQSQVNKLMYEALSMVSHELRSPLLVIQRNAEALALGALGELTPRQLDAIGTIQSAVRREFVLLNAHLDLSRIERGAERLQYQEYDLVELVREEMDAHRAEATRKRIDIRSHLPKRRAIVRIDVNRFRVALNPLMDNAIKFSDEGGEVAIDVRLKPAYVEVQISDQGPGIKPGELDRLMNLQSVDATSFSQRMRNSGLGLSMSKRMIELHEGRFWIESDGENGTAVSFRLPIKKMR